MNLKNLTEEDFDELASHSRIIISGAPKAGKTTLANLLSLRLSRPVYHTDDLISSHSWAEQSSAVASWISLPAPYLIEGVTTPRGLRQFLKTSSSSPLSHSLPILLISLPTPLLPLSPSSLVFSRGLATTLSSLFPLPTSISFLTL